MNDWQIQQMKEDADARKWEEQNAPKMSEERIKKIDMVMRFAIDELDNACDSANEAMELLDDTPLHDVMESILMDMEEVLADLRMKYKGFERGEY